MSVSDLPADQAPATRPLVEPGPFVALGVIAAIAIAFLAYTIIRRPAIPAVVSQDYTSVAGAVLVPEVRQANARELAAALDAAQPGLGASVPDLGRVGYRLDGGGVHAVVGRRGIVAIYHNTLQDLVVWQVFEGAIADLPATTDVRERAERHYYVHHKSAYALVFWQDGPRVNVVTSSLPAEQVVAIAFEAS